MVSQVTPIIIRSELDLSFKRVNAWSPHVTPPVETLILRVPRLRSASFSTDLFFRYQRSEQASV
jgi:transposase-like protein